MFSAENSLIFTWCYGMMPGKKGVAMVGLMSAMGVEMALLQEQMTECAHQEIGMDTFVSGKLYGQDAVIAVCGAGKINAAICAWNMIQHYHPQWILNVGVAGSGDDSLEIGDLVVGTDSVQHDMDTTGVGDPRGYVSKVGVVRFPCDPVLRDRLLAAAREVAGDRVQAGTIATGDQFVSDPEVKSSIHALFQAKAVEMEGAAVAHACWMAKVPYGILRAISDNANGDSPRDFPAFAAEVAEVSQRVIFHLLRQGEHS